MDLAMVDPGGYQFLILVDPSGGSWWTNVVDPDKFTWWILVDQEMASRLWILVDPIYGSKFSTICILILGNYKDNYDTATTTANKSMGFDLSAIQFCIYCCVCLLDLA